MQSYISSDKRFHNPTARHRTGIVDEAGGVWVDGERICVSPELRAMREERVAQFREIYPGGRLERVTVNLVLPPRRFFKDKP